MRASVILILLALLPGVASAADQTIVGTLLQVKDPKPGVAPTKRTILGKGLERHSPNTIVGDPTATGASLTVFATGTTSSSQTYSLPASFWTAVKGGFTYKDAKLVAGPVKTAQVKVSKRGTFHVQALALGTTAGISVVPPNTGTDGCLLFEITGGDRYHVLFPAPPNSTIKKNDAKGFVVKDATVQGVCPQTCTPGAPGCGWKDGDLTTFTQADWGDTPNGSNAASLVESNYDAVYAPMGLFEIGIPGASGFSVLFTGSATLLDYLPAAGALGPLDTDLVDPTSTASGQFGGDVAALKLDTDFSDAGVTPHTSAVKFGDLHLCAMTPASFNGMTVRDVAGVANTLLGGGSAAFTITDVDVVAVALGASFGGGAASMFAQQHLVNGACP